MNEQEIGTVLATLKSAYPRERIPKETWLVYSNALGDLSFLETMLAVKTVVQEDNYFPSIARLRFAVAERTLDLPTATEAWEQAQARAFERPQREQCDACHDGFLDSAREQTCRMCGGEGYRLVFSASTHPLVRRVMAMLGGPAGIRDADRPEFVGREFRKLYEEARRDALREVVRGSDRDSVTREAWEAIHGPPNVVLPSEAVTEPPALSREENAERVRELSRRLARSLGQDPDDSPDGGDTLS